MLTKIKTFFSMVWREIVDTWERIKVFVLAALAIAAVLGFRQLKEYLLMKSGQKEIQKDNAKDQNLAVQEKNENQKADDLVADAQKLQNESQTPVDENWYKGDKS